MNKKNIKKEESLKKDENHKHNHEHHKNENHEHHHNHSGSKGKKIKIILYVVSIILFAVGFVPVLENYRFIIYLVSVLLCAYDLILEGIVNIFKLNFEEDTLMAIAVIAAFCMGEYPESVMVVFLYKIGEELEERAIEKSHSNIEEIAQIKAETANLYNGNEYEVVDVNKLKVGDKILIKPGEKVPVDSIIIKGNSNLDTQAITGESATKEVVEGEEILSGTINLTGSLECTVKNTFENSTASQIVDLVHEATNNKGKAEKFITRFSKVYTPIVILLAIVIAVGIPLYLKQDFSEWIRRSLIFLVASCPCSLVISIPLAFFSCLGATSKKGIIIKGTKHIENLAKANAICFDKTGTITTGKPRIDNIKLTGICLEEDILRYVYSLESLSNHPIASAIEKMNRKVRKSEVEEFKEIPGHGLTGRIDDKRIVIGNKKILDKFEVKYKKLEEGAIYVAVKGELAACINLREEIREDAKKITKAFEKTNISRLIMLTGDNEKSANKVAEKIGIKEVYSGLLPQDKVEKVKQLKKKRNKVIFIGDGINDSPVLATADFGISMGEGTEIANSSADAILLSNEISKLPEIIKVARKTMKIVKTNIAFSIIAKLIVLTLGIFGLAPIWLAVFADTGVTFLTVLNSMRIFK